MAWFEEQPVKIPWYDDAGAERIYVPDVEIRFVDGIFLNRRVGKPVLAEVKFRDDLGKNWRTLRPKLRSGFKQAYSTGSTFRIFTEAQVRGLAFRNAEFIRKHLHGECDTETITYLKGSMPEQGAYTAERLASCLPFRELQKGLHAVWTLVAQGVLATDIEAPISPLSLIVRGWNYDKHKV